MRIGIIDLLLDTVATSWVDRAHGAFLRRQYYSLMPQAVSVWCRQLGHQVFYVTWYGQQDPKSLLPDDLDVVFVATYTQASAIACALARLYRRDGALTVIGGPHAKAFPDACLAYFDIVVKECDKVLVEDILGGHVDPPAIVTSGRALRDIPGVEERMPEVAAATFSRGRPTATTIFSLLASVGCPYACDFCVDWNNRYIALPGDRIAADLHYLSKNYPGAMIAFHDPNFAVRFDETMDIIETVPEGRRNAYFMESSLSILKDSRLRRLRATNCIYVAPGVESWAAYSDKAGTGAREGREKLEQVIAHFELLQRYVPGLQANFLFGTDVDRGREPVELTNEFMRRLPSVWPGINIPTPYGGTPLYEQYLRQGRILRSMPIALYFAPYLVTTLKHYGPLEYYDHLIDMYEVMTSNAMLVRRLATEGKAVVRIAHAIRTFAMRQELAEQRRVRAMLAGDPQFRAFHEGRSDVLPEFYHRRYEQRLGRYAELIPRTERIPKPHEQAGHGPVALPA